MKNPRLIDWPGGCVEITGISEDSIRASSPEQRLGRTFSSNCYEKASMNYLLDFKKNKGI
jgi:hypothetical protein